MAQLQVSLSLQSAVSFVLILMAKHVGYKEFRTIKGRHYIQPAMDTDITTTCCLIIVSVLKTQIQVSNSRTTLEDVVQTL